MEDEVSRKIKARGHRMGQRVYYNDNVAVAEGVVNHDSTMARHQKAITLENSAINHTRSSSSGFIKTKSVLRAGDFSFCLVFRASLGD